MVVVITPSLARVHRTNVPFKSEVTLSPLTTAADISDESDASVFEKWKCIPPKTATFVKLSGEFVKIVALISPVKPGTEAFQATDEPFVWHVSVNCSPEHTTSELCITIPMARYKQVIELD